MDVSGRSTTVRTIVVPHADLGPWWRGLQALFDAEYLTVHGPWDPDQPYGYAPADRHVVAVSAGEVVGHVGLQRRSIDVGGREVEVAGVGGVLVSSSLRTGGVGRLLLDAAGAVITDPLGSDFGYLGCREEVASFYVSCGWHRIRVRESFTDPRTGRFVVQDPGPPLLVHAGLRPVEQWPGGDVDLRGRPW